MQSENIILDSILVGSQPPANTPKPKRKYTKKNQPPTQPPPTQNENQFPDQPQFEISPPKKQSKKPKKSSPELESTRMKIRIFFDTFPEKLKTIKHTNTQIENLDETECEELLKQIQEMVGARNSIDTMAAQVPLVIKLIEDFATEFTPLRLAGTHMAACTPECQDLIKYCLIDAGITGFGVTPQQKLAFTLIAAGVGRHMYNTSQELQETTTQKTQPSNTASSEQHDFGVPAQSFGQTSFAPSTIDPPLSESQSVGSMHTDNIQDLDLPTDSLPTENEEQSSLQATRHTDSYDDL